MMEAIDSPAIAPRLLGEAEAANYLGVSRSYLRKARMDGTIGNRTPGPAFIRFGTMVRYDRADLDTWIEAHRCTRVERVE